MLYTDCAAAAAAGGGGGGDDNDDIGLKSCFEGVSLIRILVSLEDYADNGDYNQQGTDKNAYLFGKFTTFIYYKKASEYLELLH